MHARSTLAHVHVHQAYAARRNCGFDYYYYYYCITPLAGVETTCHWLLAVCPLLVRSFCFFFLHACWLACVLACLHPCLLVAPYHISALFVDGLITMLTL